MPYNHLTDEEREVLLEGGTEPPYRGAYVQLFQPGVYLCRRCDAPLFHGEAKFASRTGWPSFDEAIAESVEWIEDGERVEILCANCRGHLGHVFVGEGFTPKNTRYCTNSLALRFIPAKARGVEEAVFGGGCFWCLQPAFKRITGVQQVLVGYAGGKEPNPSYRELSQTSHAEVVKIGFSPEAISYEQLLAVFFSLHDPTTKNRQGADVGRQYRSIVLYTTWEQKELCESFLARLAKELPEPVVTELVPLVAFYPAEEEHQDYFQKHPQGGYCQVVIKPKLADFEEEFRGLIREK